MVTVCDPEFRNCCNSSSIFKTLFLDLGPGESGAVLSERGAVHETAAGLPSAKDRSKPRVPQAVSPVGLLWEELRHSQASHCWSLGDDGAEAGCEFVVHSSPGVWLRTGMALLYCNVILSAGYFCCYSFLSLSVTIFKG